MFLEEIYLFTLIVHDTKDYTNQLFVLVVYKMNQYSL